MRVGSLFSGVGGMDYGLHRAGWEHAFFCEWDEWRRGVLAEHWPGVPVYDDVRVVARSGDARADEPWGGRERGRDGSWDAVDLLCGGFPCQDLSVAGQRRGLAGERSGLFHEFARIIDAVRPRWVLIENVPGLLSSNGGRDFGVVLGTLVDLGYGMGWRVLDSRFFGVPQRRRRVFIVGARADGDPATAAQRAGQVLAVGTRCPGHSPARGEAREDVAVASLSGLGTGGPDDNDAQGGRVIAETVRSHPRPGSNSLGGVIAAPLTSGGHPNSNMPGRRKEDDINLVPNEPQTFDWQMGGSWTEGGVSRSWIHDTPGRARSLVKNKTLALWEPETTGVRRLTPVECERLQALPDDWTAHGPDSRRYAALGDAVTASVAEWIGRRLIASTKEAA